MGQFSLAVLSNIAIPQASGECKINSFHFVRDLTGVLQHWLHFTPLCHFFTNFRREVISMQHLKMASWKITITKYINYIEVILIKRKSNKISKYRINTKANYYVVKCFSQHLMLLSKMESPNTHTKYSIWTLYFHETHRKMRPNW